MVCKVCNKNFDNLGKHVATSYGREKSKKHMPYLAYLAQYEQRQEYSKNNLSKMYVIDMKSTTAISEELNVHKPTLLYLMHYYEIPLRSASEATKNQIKRDGLWNKGKTKKDHESISRYANNRQGKNNPYYTAPGFEARHQKNIERFLGIHRQQCHRRLPKSTEGRMSKILDSANIGYIRNFCLKRPDGSWRLFDFLIGNLLLEMQGNYYHANPEIFEPEDEIVISKTKRKASDIWEYDKEKANLAIESGYDYIAIWESDFANMTDSDILEVLNVERR